MLERSIFRFMFSQQILETTCTFVKTISLPQLHRNPKPNLHPRIAHREKLTNSHTIMSFLTKTVRPASASLPRLLVANAPRTFTTSLLLHKTAAETVKSGLKSVDRAVSDKVVDGIDMACTSSCPFLFTHQYNFPSIGTIS